MVQKSHFLNYPLLGEGFIGKDFQGIIQEIILKSFQNPIPNRYPPKGGSNPTQRDSYWAFKPFTHSKKLNGQTL